MEIKTKYNIGDILSHKFKTADTWEKDSSWSSEQTTLVHEVKDINTNTCCAGTQVFYHMRPLHVIYRIIKEKDKPDRLEYKGAQPGFHKENNGLIIMREDDLKPSSDQIVKDIMSGLPKDE